ncbi:hypothetical protein BG000_010537 [Podila horticola]|nr:hypothetical protein BG000_010537 [Podila horticola]
MVKCGYSDTMYEIPPLDKILWNCDPDIIGSHLTMDTVGPLIDKAIGYLQGLALPKRIKQVRPTRQECFAIITFLDMQEGDNGQSNLSRVITSDQIVIWMCQSHMHQRFDQRALEDLKAFVVGEGGHVHVNHSTIKVDLGSSVKADQFRALLMEVKHVFDISIKLHWQATRSYAESLFLDISKTGTKALEIDGITLDIIPRYHLQYSHNLFSDVIMEQTQLQVVTLLNYPRPLEQDGLQKFGDMVSTAYEASDCITAVGELEAVLEKFGLADVTVVTIYNGDWDAVFDLDKHAFVETEPIVKMWHDASNSFRLTLLDRMLDCQGRVLARLAIKRSDGELSGNSIINIFDSDANPQICQQREMDTPLGLQFLEWDCDHIRRKISNYFALFTDMATQQHPSVLTSLALDITSLSHAGLVSVKNILHRSSLDHFCIMCSHIHPSLYESITEVLGSVPWLTLKSLVLSGDSINEWLQLWPLSAAPQLLSSQIRGTGDLQELSHSSILFVHHLVSESPLMELHVENVQLQDKQDWMLIVDGLDPVSLTMFRLCNSSHSQFVACGDAVDLFISHFAATQQDQVTTRIASTSFTLDVVSPSRQSLERYQGVLRFSEFEHLHVVCTPFDPDLCNAVAQMLHYIPWSTLKTLSITGGDVNSWIQHLPSVA